MRNRLLLARAGFSPAYLAYDFSRVSRVDDRFHRRFCAAAGLQAFSTGKKVRLELKNISGKVTVESWNRDEIKISATMESSSTTVSPKQYGEGVIVDVISDNRGRSDVGNVNFKIQVPLNSTVDIKPSWATSRLPIFAAIWCALMLAPRATSNLPGINAKEVYAQNTSGNIFFDGEVIRGGKYQFQSGKGDISIRIPASSTFDLDASAPDRKLALGQFWNSGFRTVGEGQKYSKTIGDVNDGRAKVTIMNFHGGITFIRR